MRVRSRFNSWQNTHDVNTDNCTCNLLFRLFKVWRTLDSPCTQSDTKSVLRQGSSQQPASRDRTVIPLSCKRSGYNTVQNNRRSVDILWDINNNSWTSNQRTRTTTQKGESPWSEAWIGFPQLMLNFCSICQHTQEVTILCWCLSSLRYDVHLIFHPRSTICHLRPRHWMSSNLFFHAFRSDNRVGFWDNDELYTHDVIVFISKFTIHFASILMFILGSVLLYFFRIRICLFFCESRSRGLKNIVSLLLIRFLMIWSQWSFLCIDNDDGSHI